jgi:N-acyl homoserine lactone hydrolase
MKLYIFESAIIHPAPGTVLAGEVPESIPVMFYLIVHPKGLALFDTGMNLENWPLPYKKDGEQRSEQMIDAQLAKLGYTPDDIAYVIMSHLHMDHAGGMALFPNATFIVRKAELKAAWWPEPFQWTYAFADYKDTRGYKFVQLDDHEDFDVFLDGSVVCIDTKGHTQGHQSLIVNLPKSGKTVLTADAADMADNLDDGHLPGVYWNGEETLRAIVKIQHLRREGALVMMAHDPEQFKALKIAPEYYE